MKKLLLLAGFLVGCAPGLTTARVEGISVYTTASNKVSELEKTVNEQAKAFSETSGWKQIDGRNSLALIELKSSLAHNDEAEVYSALKEMKNASALLTNEHIGLLYHVFQYETNTIPGLEKDLKNKGLNTDHAWLAARLHAAKAAKIANEAALTNDDKLITDSAIELNKALGEIYGAYAKLIAADAEKALCGEYHCGEGLTCKVRFNRAFCVDSENIVRGPAGEGRAEGPPKMDHVNKGPVTRESTK